MSIVDFMIHLKPELSQDDRTSLESEIAGMEGVMSACFSASHPHMLAVTYDPEVVSSHVVLEHVSQRGLEVQKVGL